MKRILQIGPRGLFLIAVVVALASFAAIITPAEAATETRVFCIEGDSNEGPFKWKITLPKAGGDVTLTSDELSLPLGDGPEKFQDKFKQTLSDLLPAGVQVQGVPGRDDCFLIVVSASANTNGPLEFEVTPASPPGGPLLPFTGTPVPPPPGQTFNPTIVEEVFPVGGIADFPPLAETAAEGAVAPADGSGWSAGAYSALAGGLAVALMAFGGGAWYARRRFSRS